MVEADDAISNDPLDPNNCAGYYEGVPTLSLLLQYPPPEYFPLLIIGAIIIVGNAVVSVIAWKRQLKFLEGTTYIPAFRSMMIVASFGVFGMTSFAGLFSMRSSEYLHSIANTFEVFCILFFYENMCGLLRLNDFLDGTNKFILAVPPCCCCLRFLKPAPATELTVFRLRIGIVVTIIFQTILQFVRTMRIFECQYKPDSIVGSGSNILSSVSFLFAMWGLIVVYKSGYPVLCKYKTTGKFLAFKGMIFISKFLYTILSTIASYSENAIPSYYAEVDGKKSLILKNKIRITIWTNFVAIFFSTLLLALSYRLYDSPDYEPYLKEVDYSPEANTSEAIVNIHSKESTDPVI